MENLRKKAYNLLRSTEKYTKTDMVYLTKGGFWLTLSQVVASISSLVLVIAFANLVTPETYGVYRYVLSVLGVIAIATFPGLNEAAITGISKGDESFFDGIIWKKAKWSLLTTIISLGISLYYFLNDNIVLSLCFLIVALLMPLQHTTNLYGALLAGRKDFRSLSLANSIIRITVTLGLLVCLFLTDNIFLLITVFFVPEIILQTIFLIKLKTTAKNTSSSIKSLDEIMKFGFHLSIMDVLKTIASQIDKILIFHYLGAVQLAVYTIATAAPSQIKSVLQNMNTLALPKFSSSDAGIINKTLPQKLARLEIIIVLGIICYWLIAPILFPIFFPQYGEALLLSQIFALSLLFFPRTFLSTAMVAHRKQKEMYAIRIIAPLARITIFAIALPLWGLWGAVLGSIVGNAFTALIYHYYFKKAFSVTA